MKEMLALLFLLSSSMGLTQAQATSPIIFIYDASGSMWGKLEGKTKMEIAANVLSASIEALPDEQQIGLVAYGHRSKGDCRDVETLIPMENQSKGEVISAIKAIKPLGKTPLAYTVTTIVEQLRQSQTSATVILVTDGIESCDGDICAVVNAARNEGIELRLHIVGFGLKAEKTQQLRCAAKAGDGQYYDAANADGLKNVLVDATQQTVDDPPANVSVYAVKNGVAIDANVIAYQAGNKRNSFGVRTYRDTGQLYLPPGTYNLEVAPLEGSQMNPITIEDFVSHRDRMVHRTISFDAARFNFITTNNGEGWDCTVNIKNQNGKRVGVTRTYGRSKEVEIDPGTYDIIIQALVIKGDQAKVTKTGIELTEGIIEIRHDFKTGKLYLNPTVNDASIDSVVKIIDVASGRSVASGRTYTKGKEFLLNPGNYQVVITPLGAHKDKASKTISLKLKQGDDIRKVVTIQQN